MQRERKIAALRRALGDEGQIHGNEASFYCTYAKGCAKKHHKRKLAINIESEFFHCWVCGWKGGSFMPIFRRLGENDRDYVDYVAEHESKHKHTDIAKLYEGVRLPTEFQTLSCASMSPYKRQAISYLTRRGITPDDILDYKMGYCEQGRYRDRVIIPSFDEFGELTFFVGRGIWDRVSPPYLSGRFDKDIIFNDLLVDWRKPITLVEGPFDAIKAGHNAIALQGKVPNRRLLAKIQSFMPRVYVALDSDAGDEMVSIAELLVDIGAETLVIDWPIGMKDPGDMTKEDFKKLQDRARPIANDFDVMRQKVIHSGK